MKLFNRPQQRTNAVIVGDDLYRAEYFAETDGLRSPQYSPEEVKAEQDRINELRFKFKMYRDQAVRNG